MVFCKNCGQSVDPNAAICVACGYAAGTGEKFCSNCGKDVDPGASVCISCGFALQGGAVPVPVGYEQKSKIVAGLLQIFLGGFGIGRFYLGYTNIAVIQLVVTIVTCGAGSLWGLIDGILILTGTVKVDGKGITLKD